MTTKENRFKNLKFTLQFVRNEIHKSLNILSLVYSLKIGLIFFVIVQCKPENMWNFRKNWLFSEIKYSVDWYSNTFFYTWTSYNTFRLSSLKFSRQFLGWITSYTYKRLVVTKSESSGGQKSHKINLLKLT